MAHAPVSRRRFLYTRDELLAIRSSGIDVFHPAIGIGGAAVQLDVMTHLEG